MRFGKKELVEALRAKEMTKAEANEVYDLFVETLIETLGEGHSVALKGLGAFNVIVRDAFDSKNPSTGEPVKVPAQKRLKFKISDVLKSKIKKLEV